HRTAPARAGPCGPALGRWRSRRRCRGDAGARPDPDGGGSATDTSARSRGRGAGPEGSCPSEHPNPHPDFFRGELRLEFDDRVLAVPPDERVVLHDDEQAPRLAVPPAAHLAATGPDVAAPLRPLDVRKHAEAIEDLDALPGGASLRLEGLEPIFDDDGEAQLLLEMVAARRDDL